MKVVDTPDITACPLCGFTPELLRNASKDFQVRCPNCGAHTGWGRKADMIIMWYEMTITYMRNHKEI